MINHDFHQVKGLYRNELNIPTFWVREKKQSNAKVDFVYNWKGQMIPIEVKSGKDGTLRSLHQFIEIGDKPFAVRFFDQQFSVIKTKTPSNDGHPGKNYTLINLPLYSAAKISDYLDHASDF